MKLSELTEDQFRKYFETRLAENRMRKSGGGYLALCCFHNDKTPSLSVSTSKGAWKCHAGCGDGGILEFEMKFSSCDKETALMRIAEIVGEAHLNFGSQPEAVYEYTDAFGKLLFQVVRYPGKRFSQRRKDDKGGWLYKTQGMQMVLYNLPDVVAARSVLVVEGEKAADRVKKMLGIGPPDLAVTTSPRGAGKWQDSFGAFMAGKQVLVAEDKDDPGRAHAQTVARSCHRWAQGVKVIKMPEDMPEHSGLDDYFEKYGSANFFGTVKHLLWWQPPEVEAGLFMNETQFLAAAAESIDWTVESLIQRGANGMMIARPKAGKSFAVLDLAIALASGQSWLNFQVPRRVRTALISREDYYGLTQWRMKKLTAARQLVRGDLDGWLYVNAKGLRPKVMLDYPDDVARLVEDMQRHKIEFAILDVMRVLHQQDENDNTDMQKVIDTLNLVQEQTGASLCLIHHDNKREDATLTERVRGASSITGWAEFILGVKVVEHEEHTRQFTCEIKADIEPPNFYWRIVDTPENGVKLERVEYVPPSSGRKKKTEKEEEVPF